MKHNQGIRTLIQPMSTPPDPVWIAITCNWCGSGSHNSTGSRI